MTSSLRFKIIFVVLIPFLAFIATMATNVVSSWQDKKVAEQMAANVALVQAVSGLIHEVQIERAVSVSFLNAKVEYPEVQKQMEKANAAREVFLEKLLASSTSQKTKDEAQANLQDLAQLRNNVSSKGVPVPDAIATFTAVIGKLVSVEASATDTKDVDGLKAKIMTAYLIENAKEHCGQLRANGTAILGANKPVADQVLTKVQFLKSSVDINLSSPGLEITPAIKEQIVSFYQAEHWKTVVGAYNTILKRSEVGEFNLDSNSFRVTITDSINHINEILKAHIADTQTAIQASRKNAEQDLIAMISIMLGSAIELAVVVLFVVARTTKPVLNVMKHLSSGSHEVEVASRQLHSASQQISSGAISAATSIEETMASIKEVSGQIANNAKSAKVAAELSSEGLKSAERGESEIGDLIKSMKSISDSSRKIEEIIAVIDDIAFQTNLLALNAAVEAARAGEQGRGFAVVAEAVRTLAQRSSSSAKDISTLIKESVEKIDQGVQTADRSGNALQDIVTSINKIAALNREISQASQDQAAGVAQISKAVDQLDQAVQTNATSAEEGAASANQLSGLSQGFARLVAELNLAIQGGVEANSGPETNAATRVPKQKSEHAVDGERLDKAA